MKPLQEFFATFDWNAFLQQFLYDSKNPLLFNNGFFVYFFTLFILLFFALNTILGWCYYGERCFLYLVGIRGIKFYRFMFIVLVGTGSFLTLDLIWILADIVNGLMAFPNLIALIGLRKEIISETKDYFERLKATQHDQDELA